MNARVLNRVPERFHSVRYYLIDLTNASMKEPCTCLSHKQSENMMYHWGFSTGKTRLGLEFSMSRKTLHTGVSSLERQEEYSEMIPIHIFIQ